MVTIAEARSVMSGITLSNRGAAGLIASNSELPVDRKTIQDVMHEALVTRSPIVSNQMSRQPAPRGPGPRRENTKVGTNPGTGAA